MLFGKRAASRRVGLAAIIATAIGLLGVQSTSSSFAQTLLEPAGAADGAVPEAICGPGSRPETGVQGQVPWADRKSGRSRQGYQCNLEAVGNVRGKGAGIVSARYRNCVFVGSFATSLVLARPGVQVIDVSDPAAPRVVRTLLSSAMAAGTWETLKVNAQRGLLVGVGTSVGIGALLFDVYDITGDCTNPRLLNKIGNTSLSAPLAVLGHEGDFAPDGLTYYAASTGGGWITAVDLANPAKPRVAWAGSTGLTNHGLSVSADGRTLYAVSLVPAGIKVFDVSDVQERKSFPQVRQIGGLSWADGLLTQHTIPIIQNGHPYLVVEDEAGGGSVRILDMADPTKPTIVRRIRLQINMPANRNLRVADTGGDGVWGYEAHYCNVDRLIDPTALACGFVQSGIRVFDLNDVRSPKEVAYYNPPAIGGGPENLLKIPNSPHAIASILPPVVSFGSLGLTNLLRSVRIDMNTDWCMSPPAFVAPDQLWFTCSDSGFTAVRFTNDARPAG